MIMKCRFTWKQPSSVLSRQHYKAIQVRRNYNSSIRVVKVSKALNNKNKDTWLHRLTSQRGLQVTTLYVAGSRSTRHVSVRHKVRRTGSEVRGDIFWTTNSAQDVSDSSLLQKQLDDANAKITSAIWYKRQPCISDMPLQNSQEKPSFAGLSGWRLRQ